MHYSTKQKIAAIQRFIVKNYELWTERYPEIVGMHIGKKLKAGQKQKKYAIVFHVERKKTKIPEQKIIPPYFQVTIGGKKKKIPTDVIVSGKSELSELFPGDRVHHKDNVSNFGSIGIFLTDDTNTYLLTNMHVIGKKILRSTFEIFDVPHDFDQKTEIICMSQNGEAVSFACFKSGCVDEFLDAAIAIVNPDLEDLATNIVNNAPIAGHKDVDFSVANKPLEVIIRGATSGLVKNVFITANTGILRFTYPLGKVTMLELLQISPCNTAGGDSGAPIIDAADKKLVGIVIGKDKKNTFTYGISIGQILELFKLKILKSTL
jgi:hypothetical protein